MESKNNNNYHKDDWKWPRLLTCPEAVIVCTIIILKPFIGSTLSLGVAGGGVGIDAFTAGGGGAKEKIILYLKKFRFTSFSFNVVKDVFFQYASIVSCPFN